MDGAWSKCLQTFVNTLDMMLQTTLLTGHIITVKTSDCAKTFVNTTDNSSNDWIDWEHNQLGHLSELRHLCKLFI